MKKFTILFLAATLLFHTNVFAQRGTIVQAIPLLLDKWLLPTTWCNRLFVPLFFTAMALDYSGK